MPKRTPPRKYAGRAGAGQGPGHRRDDALATLAREVGTVRKPHGGRLRVALAFPNTYFVGMSNLGPQTFSTLFTAAERVVCECVFLPGRQERTARTGRQEPFLTLESETPVSEFDVF